jgi:hypothetical protein
MRKDSPMSGLLAEILVSVPGSSIAGGTDEIQRNIISERVRKRTGDTDKPFKDVSTKYCGLGWRRPRAEVRTCLAKPTPRFTQVP